MRAETFAHVESVMGHTVTFDAAHNLIHFDPQYGGPSRPAAEWMTQLDKAMREAHCTTVPRAAMAYGQLGEESGSFRYMEELASGSEYEWRSDLGNTHAGDGVRFKGRGPIQITGRHNYGALSAWAHAKGFVPTSTFFVDHPAMLADLRYAFLGFVWYWTVARNMNGYADRKDILGATRAVNGGTNGLGDRTARWERALAAGDAILPRSAGGPVVTPKPRPTPPVVAPKPQPKPQPKPVSHPVYTVRAGDTLSSIAGAHHTTWQRLQKINNLRNPNLIYVDQKLRLA